MEDDLIRQERNGYALPSPVKFSLLSKVTICEPNRRGLGFFLQVF